MNLDLIIPTYNRSRLLKACLESVCTASRPKDLNIKVAVVDNKSTDNTAEVVQQFVEQRELACKYIFVARPGKSAALNEAIAQTREEFVGFIDDDEQLDPAWFEVIYREFSVFSPPDFIGGPYDPNWEAPPPDWLPSVSRGALGIVPRPVREEFSAMFNGILMGGNAVIRRSTLEKSLPYPEEIGKIGKKIRSGEDEVMYHRLLESGARGIVVPDLIIRHWIAADRLTKRYFRKWITGRGISIGYQLRESAVTGPELLGIPRYKFGDAIRGLPRMLTGGTQRERFAAQLSILDCLATLYGRFVGKYNGAISESGRRRSP